MYNRKNCERRNSMVKVFQILETAKKYATLVDDKGVVSYIPSDLVEGIKSDNVALQDGKWLAVGQ